MKLPRDVGGQRLAKLLAAYGYTVTRRVGSHIRLTTRRNGEHHITIPAHASLRVGTLGGILSDVAQHLGMPKEKLVVSLFE
ncbi:MAG: type II toxin-antitoxin system HicA family toxin [Planctomycetes bacterium]|nr:type II toxin-antitoxin system HicA family toxin [Planctomycetota bacterium]MBI3846623.1 type II toxin-antitoxin system HicA family toxin [Planctomycetota bacterium]